MEGYEQINAFVTPAYSYVEGNKREHYYYDSQNCFYHELFIATGDDGKRRDGKKYWIIEPYKPEGITITEENYEEVKSQIKWVVSCSSEDNDEEKEWDFDKHCVKDGNKIN